VAVSGTGRGYAFDPDTTAFVLAGDESAVPAIGTLLAALPAGSTAAVLVEVAEPEGRVTLTERDGVEVAWHDLPPGSPPGDALVAAITDTRIDDGAVVWAAGEAAAVQRIRRHLFDERGIHRSRVTVRGYWKHGRAGDDG
jgi:NADPH-dependent ferric siderophore reductase